jgi:hypothetical protein
VGVDRTRHLTTLPTHAVSDLSAYERLVGLIERELVYATAGRVDDVALAQSEKDALVATFPDRPSAEALPLLERAGALQAQVTAVLDRSRAQTLRVLGELEVGERTARGYGASARAGASAAGTLDQSA